MSESVNSKLDRQFYRLHAPPFAIPPSMANHSFGLAARVRIAFDESLGFLISQPTDEHILIHWLPVNERMTLILG